MTSPEHIDAANPTEREAFPHHECGLFGVFGHPNAAVLTYYGLFALQHRGQESAGIAVCAGRLTHIHKGMGLVAQVFNEDNLAPLRGHLLYLTSTQILGTNFSLDNNL